ncbi:hypothetical protein ACLOJK_013755 [Asimina triloba]
MDFNLLILSCNKIHLVKRLHALLLASGLAQTSYFSVKLVNLYADLRDVRLASLVFKQMPGKNIVAWNSIISGFVRNGYFHEGLDCYNKMLTTSRVQPDCFTFPVVLKACQELRCGKKMHTSIFKLGFELNFFVAASSMKLYTRFGLMDDARRIFDEMSDRDLGCWNAMISGYCQNGKAAEALWLFEEMMTNGVRMDSVTMASILPICAQLDDLLCGRLIHLYVIKHGLDLDVFVSNALIFMYAKLDCMREAQKVFDDMVVKDLVSWNSVISMYDQANEPIAVVHLFTEMKGNGFQPDMLTLVSLASAAAQLGNSQNGKVVHGFVVRKEWISQDIFVSNAIVDMYAKTGKMDYAQKLFDRILNKDAISWNTLITGYAQNGLANEAIEFFQLMGEVEGIIANQGTLVSVLPAFSHVGAVQQGMMVHCQSIHIGLNLDVFVATCLIDMYAKCGRLDDAMLFFSDIPRRSAGPWNAIISGFGIHGHGERSLQLFSQMLQEMVKPDNITFVSLLSACSHAGLVEQGQRCFQLMHETYEIEPSVRHYACMVDLLGRAGHLWAAYEFIKKMPIRPDASVWGALLGACRIHGNVELAAIASDCLFEIDSKNVGYYVLLSNMYAKIGKWERVDKVRSLARKKGLRKTPGWSSVVVNNQIHVFFTGNRSHPRSDDIYQELGVLLGKMKSLGYVPDYSFVLQDVEEDEKDHILSSHRIIGDESRFHRFKDGSYSCGDYW